MYTLHMTDSLNFLQFIKIISKHVLFLFFILLKLCFFFKIYYNKSFKVYPRFLNFYVTRDNAMIYIKV
jgi:hypothetical protein